MDTIRNDPKIESTCGSGNVIGRGGDGDQARKTCDYDTHLTRRRSLTLAQNQERLILLYSWPHGKAYIHYWLAMCTSSE